MSDPYTAVHDALWALLESSIDFRNMVPVGNRIKFSGSNRDPIKTEIATADLPEVRLIPTASNPHAYKSSCSHADMVQWEIQVATGDKRVTEFLFPLKWIIFQVMVDVEAYLKENVIWNGANIVRLARAVSVREGVSQQDFNRGIDGWSALWSIETELWFASSSFTATIQPVLQGASYGSAHGNRWPHRDG